MDLFEIQWRNSTRKDLRKIPRQEVVRILEVVERLAANPLPPGAEKLSGAEHTYRIRVGDYRIVYDVDTEVRIVIVERVRHRKDVYRR